MPICAHYLACARTSLLQEPDPISGAVAVPISLASTFAQVSPGVPSVRLLVREWLLALRRRFPPHFDCCCRAETRSFLIVKDLSIAALATQLVQRMRRCVASSCGCLQMPFRSCFHGTNELFTSVIALCFFECTYSSSAHLMCCCSQCLAAAESAKHGTCHGWPSDRRNI